MSNIMKELIADAMESYEADRNNPIYRAVREIVSVEKEYHYDAAGDNRRLKRLREIIAKEAISGEILEQISKDGE